MDCMVQSYPCSVIRNGCDNVQGVVAVACTDPQSFNQRVDSLGAAPAPHAVLVWNFRDPIHPELVLESPYEVFCFQSNPLQPEVITGGLYNGQIIMWDTASQEVAFLLSLLHSCLRPEVSQSCSAMLLVLPDLQLLLKSSAAYANA